jgi:phosphatidate cytidylyltransferase
MKYTLSNYSNLTQRIIAALIGAAVVITSIVLSEWGYFVIFLIICGFSIWEFYKLLGLDGMVPLKTYGTFSGVSLYIISFFIQKGDLHQDYYFLIFPILAGIFFIKLYKKSERKPFTNIAFTFLGITYVAMPFSLLNAGVFFKGSYNFEIVLGTLLLLWASDTGAYFAGTKFGKTKLFERISPKKSWEGFFGGFALSLLMAFGISYFSNELAVWQWITISIIIVVVGTYGDLVESLFKRSIEIKDSGTSIPGHGGFLDRFDGLFLSIPFIVAFLALI